MFITYHKEILDIYLTNLKVLMLLDSYFANINESSLIDVTHPVSFLRTWTPHSSGFTDRS